MNKQLKQRYYVASLLMVLVASALLGFKQAAAADVADFALGVNNICIVDTDGMLECSSNRADRFIPPATGNTYSKVSSGGQHSCAITQAGDIECWGDANFGVLNVPV